MLKMMGKIVAVIATVVVITGCSSNAPDLPNSWRLGTTSKSQNYYYCESCPAPTKLINQVYQPLEPDEPIIAVKPVAEPIQITNNKRSKKHHYRKKSKYKIHKPVKSKKPKQCIEWSK